MRWAGARRRSAGSAASRRSLREDELAVGGVDLDAVALGELALQQPQRQLVDELLLDHPLQRAGAVGRVEAEVADQLAWPCR